MVQKLPTLKQPEVVVLYQWDKKERARFPLGGVLIEPTVRDHVACLCDPQTPSLERKGFRHYGIPSVCLSVQTDGLAPNFKHSLIHSTQVCSKEHNMLILL